MTDSGDQQGVGEVATKLDDETIDATAAGDEHEHGDGHEHLDPDSLEADVIDEAIDADELPGEVTTRRSRLWRATVYLVLPLVVMGMAGVAGYFKYQYDSLHDAAVWRAESVQAAKDGAVAILSYRPDTVDNDLGSARQRLTGDFQNAYSSLTHDVVIPGAKQRQISAAASVPAAASISATESDAQVLVFVNQTTIVGTDAPSDTASVVKVTLKRSGKNWLISGFDPI